MAKEKMLLQRWKAALSACICSACVGLAAYLVSYNWSSRLEKISRLPPNRLFRESKALQQLMNFNSRVGSTESYQNAQRFNPRSTDVFLVTYPKSGTTWISQIAHGLRSNGSMAFDEISDVVPWDVAALDCGQDLNAEQGFSPRLFKSHLTSDTIAKGARYVVLVRNPDDVLVSLHRHFCEGDWPKVAGFAREDLPLRIFAAGVFASHFNEGYWHHLASWYTCCWNDPAVHWVTYEDLKDNVSKEVQRLADFMGLDGKDRPRLAVAEAQSSRDFMLKHHKQFDDHGVLQHTLPKHALEVLTSAPTRPKVQRASSPKKLNGELKALLDARWAQLITPVTGWMSFRQLREAIHHRTVHKSNTSLMVSGATTPPQRAARGPLFLLHRMALTNAARAAGVTFGMLLLLLAVLFRHPRLVHCLPGFVQMCLLPAKEDEPPCPDLPEGGSAGCDPQKPETPIVSSRMLVLGMAAAAVGVLCFFKVGFSKESAKNVCTALHREPCKDLFASLAAAKRAGVVVSAFAEDLLWLSEIPPGPTWVYAHSQTGPASAHPNAHMAERVPVVAFSRARTVLEAFGNIRFVDRPNVGDEAGAYLWHIVHHYDELPEVLAFVHGHRQSRHHSDFDMAELLNCLCGSSNEQGILYQSLNSKTSRQPVCFPTRGMRKGRKDKYDRPRRIINRLWAQYFAEEFGDVQPDRHCMDCCGQFITTRAAIRSHPRDFYVRLLIGVDNGKINGYDMEMFWRKILLEHT